MSLVIIFNVVIDTILYFDYNRSAVTVLNKNIFNEWWFWNNSKRGFLVLKKEAKRIFCLR